MEFHIDTHKLKGTPMVEVWNDGEFIAGIYSHGDGIKVVRKYLDGVTHEAGMPPASLSTSHPRLKGVRRLIIGAHVHIFYASCPNCKTTKTVKSYLVQKYPRQGYDEYVCVCKRCRHTWLERYKVPYAT